MCFFNSFCLPPQGGTGFLSPMTTATPVSADESFAALFEESLALQEMRTGEVITAEVVRIDQNFVVVNAGLKSESYVPVEEFRNDRGELEVEVGDSSMSRSTPSRTASAKPACRATRPSASRPGMTSRRRSTTARWSRA
jgi:hypothetical protein